MARPVHMPVCAVARPCLSRIKMLSYGLLARPCALAVCDMDHFSHDCVAPPILKHARVLGRVFVKTLVFKISISVLYLKSAELWMTHLHRTEWKNTEYHKRDFLIECGSDNVGIRGI
ncbi:hypothetical protein GOBAR_AA30067 [Gossypium barbadense]|uniref:Uncharacterized protein n=1 Tax=Gossypium barbadense TaxID=3634 RepID=A0A2P5WHQ7_GOSBA|nr:hypothetical protein GOBAR_AA30067 [Gossypium barbadense]